MLRIAQHLGGRANLHQIATVHDGDAIGNIRNHTHVVSHQHAADLTLLTQRLDEFEDLILDRHIQRRGGFIGDDELRITGQGDGDDHPLAHPTGELVRVLLDTDFRLRNADRGHQLDGPRLGRLATQLGVGLDGFDQLTLHGKQRVQRRHRILEDEADVGTAHLAHLGGGQAGDLLPIEEDITAGDTPRRAQQIDDGITNGGLTGPGLTHHAEDLAFFDGKGEILDRGHHTATGWIFDPQIPDFKQGHDSTSQGLNPECFYFLFMPSNSVVKGGLFCVFTSKLT